MQQKSSLWLLLDILYTVQYSMTVLHFERPWLFGGDVVHQTAEELKPGTQCEYTRQGSLCNNVDVSEKNHKWNLGLQR